MLFTGPEMGLIRFRAVRGFRDFKDFKGFKDYKDLKGFRDFRDLVILWWLYGCCSTDMGVARRIVRWGEVDAIGSIGRCLGC